MRITPFISYLIVVLAAMAAVYALNDRAIERTRNAELTACARVQLLRDQANGTNVLIYEYFNDAAKATRARIKSEPENANVLRSSAKRLQSSADQQTVTGPTDCRSAVDHPGTYQAPAPEFIKNDTKQVQLARERAEAIVEKARLNAPLFGPSQG